MLYKNLFLRENLRIKLIEQFFLVDTYLYHSYFLKARYYRSETMYCLQQL